MMRRFGEYPVPDQYIEVNSCKLMKTGVKIGAFPLPKGEGAAKRRVRGTERNCFSCGTPHPAFGHPLPSGEGRPLVPAIPKGPGYVTCL